MSEWTSIDELVAECMADPVKRARIIAARATLAPVLYPDRGPHYERLMRGEGPTHEDKRCAVCHAPLRDHSEQDRQRCFDKCCAQQQKPEP